MNDISGQLTQIIEMVTPILFSYSDKDMHKSPGAGEWSKKQILGHLIDSAANNNQRFIRILIEAPAAIPPYQPEKWVVLQGYQEHDWQLMVTLWAAYNRHIAFVIQRIPLAELDRECSIGDKPPVTLRWLIEDYLRHLKDHLRQVVAEPELESVLH